MPSRVTPAGNQVTGTPAPVAFGNGVPGGWIGLTQKTTSMTGTFAGEADVTGLSITVTVNSSRRLKITGYCQGWFSDTAGDRVEMKVYRGATVLVSTRSRVQSANSTESNIVSIATDTPASGNQTYKVTLIRSLGTGTITFAGSTGDPSWIMVEDLGPA